nr:MAG TPA: hypothetical protein [Caudoviricetes sp.]
MIAIPQAKAANPIETAFATVIIVLLLSLFG